MVGSRVHHRLEHVDRSRRAREETEPPRDEEDDQAESDEQGRPARRASPSGLSRGVLTRIALAIGQRALRGDLVLPSVPGDRRPMRIGGGAKGHAIPRLRTALLRVLRDRCLTARHPAGDEDVAGRAGGPDGVAEARRVGTARRIEGEGAQEQGAQPVLEPGRKEVPPGDLLVEHARHEGLDGPILRVSVPREEGLGDEGELVDVARRSHPLSLPALGREPREGSHHGACPGQGGAPLLVHVPGQPQVEDAHVPPNDPP